MSVQPVRKIFFSHSYSYLLLTSRLLPYWHNTTSTSIHRPPLVASMAAFRTNGRTQCGLACSLGLSRYRCFAYGTLRLLDLLSLVLSPCSASCAYYHNPPNTPTPHRPVPAHISRYLLLLYYSCRQSFIINRLENPLIPSFFARLA